MFSDIPISRSQLFSATANRPTRVDFPFALLPNATAQYNTFEWDAHQPSPITVTFQPTKGDLIRIGYLGLLCRPFVLKLWMGFFVGVPWVSALLFLGNQEASLISIITLFLLPLLAIFLFSLIPLWTTLGARHLKGTHSYTFSEDGIRLMGPGFDSRLDWAIVTRCYSFGLGVLLVSGKTPVLSVPGRALSSATKSQLRQMIVVRSIELAGQWKQ